MVASPASAPRHIVHLTSVHRPDDVRIAHKQCASIQEEGYRVSLIAPLGPREPTPDLDSIANGARLLPVNRRDSRALRMTLTCAEVCWRAVAANADLYHFHDPELMPVGLALRVMGKRVVYDAHEDLPKAIRGRHWIPSLLRSTCAAAAGGFERLASGLLSGVVSATPSIHSRFVGRRTAIIQNYPRLNEFNTSSDQPYESRSPIVAYIGGLTAERGARELVTALGKVSDSLSARMTLAGVLRPARLEAELRELSGWDRIDFLGWRSRQDVGRILGAARLGVVTFLPAPNHIEAQPNKLFEYMAAGLPVVASRFPRWEEVVSECRCGILVDPTSADEITQAIEWLLENPSEAHAMGLRGRQAVAQRFNWHVESRALLDFYSRLLDDSPPRITKRRGGSHATTALRKSA